MAKPLLSRSLANKIRRAQDDVTHARRAIIRGELAPDSLRDDLAAVDEWEREGLLSYHSAVSRRDYIERQLAREVTRQPERFLELARAEEKLADVEAEVGASVAKIRAGAVLVTWPRRLPTFETVAERYRHQQDRENVEARNKAGRYFTRLDATYSKQMAKHDEAVRKSVTSLATELVKAVKSGEMSEDAALKLIRSLGGQ